MTSVEKIRDMVSHRVVFGYEDGTTITGYVSACRPAAGLVRTLSLTRVEITDPEGNVIEKHRELVVVPSVLVGCKIAEGPSASTL